MKCFIFDLDGTLADDSHRHHHISKSSDWDAYYAACPDDKPIQHMIEVAKALHAAGFKIAIVTGRSETIRAETEAWLLAHGVLWNELMMRKRSDRRRNSELKQSAVKRLREKGYKILMVFEDLMPAVKAYRALGLPCAHVADHPYFDVPHP